MKYQNTFCMKKLNSCVVIVKIGSIFEIGFLLYTVL